MSKEHEHGHESARPYRTRGGAPGASRGPVRLTPVRLPVRVHGRPPPAGRMSRHERESRSAAAGRPQSGEIRRW